MMSCCTMLNINVNLLSKHIKKITGLLFAQVGQVNMCRIDV